MSDKQTTVPPHHNFLEEVSADLSHPFWQATRQEIDDAAARLNAPELLQDFLRLQFSRKLAQDMYDTFAGSPDRPVTFDEWWKELHRSSMNALYGRPAP